MAQATVQIPTCNSFPAFAAITSAPRCPLDNTTGKSTPPPKSFLPPPPTPAGGTDSGNYVGLNSGNVLRFVPRATSGADSHRAHGTDERLGLDSFRGALCTFEHGLQAMDSAGTEGGHGSPAGAGKRAAGGVAWARGIRAGGAASAS